MSGSGLRLPGSSRRGSGRRRRRATRAGRRRALTRTVLRVRLPLERAGFRWAVPGLRGGFVLGEARAGFFRECWRRRGWRLAPSFPRPPAFAAIATNLPLAAVGGRGHSFPLTVRRGGGVENRGFPRRPRPGAVRAPGYDGRPAASAWRGPQPRRHRRLGGGRYWFQARVSNRPRRGWERYKPSQMKTPNTRGNRVRGSGLAARTRMAAAPPR